MPRKAQQQQFRAMANHNRRTAFSGVLAILLTMGAVVLFILYAIVLKNIPRFTFVFAITASVFAMISIFLIGMILVKQFTTNNRLKNRWMLLSTLAICILSAMLAFGTLSWMSAILGQMPPLIYGAPTSTFVYATFIVCASTLACQCVFILCALDSSRRMLRSREQVSEHDLESQGTTEGGLGCFKKEFIHITNKGIGRPYPKTGAATVPPADAHQAQPYDTGSHHVVYVNQKDHLFSSPPEMATANTGSSPIDPFDTWDVDTTSPILSFTSPAMLNTESPKHVGFLQTSSSTPVVPADMSMPPDFIFDLDAPPKLSDIHMRSPSLASQFSATTRTETRTSYDSGIMEAHIHPLFRTDSPEPPPATTVNTCVVAASSAGQLINSTATRQVIKRMRSGTLPSSITTPAAKQNPQLAHSTLGDIVDELVQADWQKVARTENMLRVNAASDSRAPFEREMTPPIPEWILGAGARSSLLGYSKRKKESSLPDLRDTCGASIS